MRKHILALTTLILSGCAGKQSDFAPEAQRSLLGRPIEQVLQCVGQPDRKLQMGTTTVWLYDSPDPRDAGWTGSVALSTSDSAPEQASAAAARTAPQQCTMNVIMRHGYVSEVRYTTPSGAPLTGEARCPFAIMTWCPTVGPPRAR
jgi:hypothetical protein